MEIPPDLQPESLLGAYAMGIFPMADRNGCLEWFSPDPRAILELNRFKISRSLRSRIRKNGYEIRINTCFRTVIERCADRSEGTWISREIIEAYCLLREWGFAHSVETFFGNQLAGGLYGVSLGGAFFGESMFTLLPDGSKLALVALVERMKQRGMTLLDIQFMTDHLARFGATEISRAEYLQRLNFAIQQPIRFADAARITALDT